MREAIHRAFDDPRRNQRVLGQARDQSLGCPTTKGRIHRQALAPFCPAAQAGQIGLHGRFVNEDNAIWQGGNGRQAVFEPIGTLLPHLRTSAFGGNQRLFYT